MNYTEYNDYELLNYISENNEEASEIIYKKYEPIIKNIAGKMYPYCKNYGIEINDLYQEGMVGLAKAIENYKDNKDATFYTFAIKCIERSMIDLKNGANRLKHKALNDSLPIEIDDEEGNHYDNVLAKIEEDPEFLLITKERENFILEKLNETMTELEKQVFKLKYQNYNYKEIAEILKKDPKSIDNALQRIKNKLNNIIK